MEEKIDLVKLSELAEKLRKNVIGDPGWAWETQKLEYWEQTIEVVVILKLLRAIQGIKSQLVLCKEGLFIDMGALFRCTYDCNGEIYFLLEKYPEQSEHVKQFIKKFFEGAMNNCDFTTMVKTQKIRSAYVSYLTGQDEDENVRKTLKKPYEFGCEYIHASYVSIMEIMENYGGSLRPKISFNLLGVPSPSKEKKSEYYRVVEGTYLMILRCMLQICITFKADDIKEDVEKLLSPYRV